MRQHSYILLPAILGIFCFVSCQTSPDSESKLEVTQVKHVADNSSSESEFNDYWYSGKAEISSYKLSQARYGELRDGSATLIFVTEPFSKSKQVKLDYPSRADKDKVAVLKLNFVKKFVTGVYPYSMMMSTFVPVDSYNHPEPLKMTMSSQEWCGHVFSQLNLDNNKYNLKSYSYFESEGDTDVEVDQAFLEDEIWTRIRLDHKSLPVGDIEIIPGLFHTRLKHKNYKALKAQATLDTSGDEATYEVKYKNGRELKITFGNSFPHRILSWSETSKGIGGKKLRTTATFDKTLYIDYWNRNSNADLYLRDSLNLQ